MEAASILDELAAPYMLIGGLAVSAWGVLRATLDVDVSLWVEPERFESTVGALCSQLQPVPMDPLLFARETRVLPMISSHGIRVESGLRVSTG